MEISKIMHILELDCQKYLFDMTDPKYTQMLSKQLAQKLYQVEKREP